MKQSVMMIVGNWKMNGLADSLGGLVADLIDGLEKRSICARVVLCPPATLIERVARAVEGHAIAVGGQDCRAEASGAFTGDVSAPMLADAGASWVILGHSERRQGHGEGDDDVRAKLEGALKAGLKPIVCVGETLAEREDGRAGAVVAAQVRASLPDGLVDADFALAYEPVWAIGTGRTPTLEEIAEIHDTARRAMVERLGQGASTAPILYGGSVNAANAGEILGVAGVDGALVGGASLKAADFLAIVAAAEPARVAVAGQQ